MLGMHHKENQRRVSQGLKPPAMIDILQTDNYDGRARVAAYRGIREAVLAGEAQKVEGMAGRHVWRVLEIKQSRQLEPELGS